MHRYTDHRNEMKQMRCKNELQQINADQVQRIAKADSNETQFDSKDDGKSVQNLREVQAQTDENLMQNTLAKTDLTCTQSLKM